MLDARQFSGPKYPGTGWFRRLFMRAVLRKIAADLAGAQEAITK